MPVITSSGVMQVGMQRQGVGEPLPPTSTESETLILSLDKYTGVLAFFFFSPLNEMHHSVWVTLHLRWLSTFDDLLQLSNDLFQQIQHNASGKPPIFFWRNQQPPNASSLRYVLLRGGKLATPGNKFTVLSLVILSTFHRY